MVRGTAKGVSSNDILFVVIERRAAGGHQPRDQKSRVKSWHRNWHRTHYDRTKLGVLADMGARPRAAEPFRFWYRTR
jgi:hypothetical protein